MGHKKQNKPDAGRYVHNTRTELTLTPNRSFFRGTGQWSRRASPGAVGGRRGVLHLASEGQCRPRPPRSPATPRSQPSRRPLARRREQPGAGLLPEPLGGLAALTPTATEVRASSRSEPAGAQAHRQSHRAPPGSPAPSPSRPATPRLPGRSGGLRTRPA